MSDNMLVRKLFHWFFLLKRPITLGVRVLARNDAGDILLVKHTYVAGWHLPGGGVEIGETPKQAIRKELREETGFAAEGEIRLLASYYNTHASKRDHVLLYECGQIREARVFKPNSEIKEIGFFSKDALPEGISKGTARRIEEHVHGGDVSEYW